MTLQLQSMQAFGNNMVMNDGAASIFSGDVDQDGSVEFSDILLVHNDVSAFATGYVNTDLNGDELVDISDLIHSIQQFSDVQERLLSHKIFGSMSQEKL